ncbi:MAG: zinc ribbon domain-containing protein [Methanobacterium paludis]|nr:zinc ribbon domain-containing protein [Methanobacterium paludis]
MLCKKCGTEIKDGNSCPKCGTKIVTTKSRLLSILLALGVIVSAILGINGDKEIFGYKITTIFFTLMVIGIIIAFTWVLARKKPKISINTIKRDFSTLKRTLKEVNSLPENYKNIVLIGYFSIILVFLSSFFDLISNTLYGTLNGNWGGSLAVVTLSLGIILFLYSWTIMFIKLRKINNKSTLQTHYNLIWGFFIIWIFLNSLLTS